MAYRGGRGYGQSYGAFGSDQVDPLAAAIMGALGMGTQLFETVRGVRQENADRRDMANARLKAEARQAEQDAIERERWDYKVSLDQQERQDALAREKRQREQALGDRLTERGIAAIPTPMGGTTYAKVAQTDDELKAAMQDRLATDRLRQQAKALGIPDADKMSRGELEVLTSEVMKGRERDAEFGDFRRRESYQEGLIRGRPTRGAGGPNGRPLSANLADTLGSYNALIGTADDALAKFDKAAGVDPTTGKSTKALTGWFDGLRNTSLAQNLGMGMGKDATSAVAALSNLASSIMKDRSGGAITPQEFERLQPFLPSKYDNEEDARQKMVDLKSTLEQIREARLSALEGSGYDVSALRGSGRAPAAGDAFDQKADEWLARRRKGGASR